MPALTVGRARAAGRLRRADGTNEAWNAAGTRIRAAELVLARVFEIGQFAALDQRVRQLEEIAAAEMRS
jgi:hypothetical protein